jgi:enoyl-CoA hydratase/carnithine racemase
MQRVELDSKFLEGTFHDGALRVVINRPERRNACPIQMYHGIKKAAVLADRNPEVDALILTGWASWPCRWRPSSARSARAKG